MSKNQSGQCRCEACGQRFCGLTAFDLHRVGDYLSRTQPNTRRCLSEDEMRARGMAQGPTGVWASGKSPARRTA